MEISLAQSVLEGLPSPDDQGLVRVTVALRMGEGGKADIVEVNDTPVPGGTEEETEGADEALNFPSPEEVGASMI